MGQGISLIILSIISMSSFALLYKPNTIILLNKVVPYQGWMGLAFGFWGVFSIISNSILKIEEAQLISVCWISTLLVNTMHVFIGYLLGYSLISQYVYSANKEAKEKGNQLLIKMALLHSKAGIFGVITGIASILSFLIYCDP